MPHMSERLLHMHEWLKRKRRHFRVLLVQHTVCLAHEGTDTWPRCTELPPRARKLSNALTGAMSRYAIVGWLLSLVVGRGWARVRLCLAPVAAAQCSGRVCALRHLRTGRALSPWRLGHGRSRGLVSRAVHAAAVFTSHALKQLRLTRQPGLRSACCAASLVLALVQSPGARDSTGLVVGAVRLSIVM